MTQNTIFKVCKDLGCCDACCLRYLGLKNPNIYENPQKSATKFQDPPPDDKTTENNVTEDHNIPETYSSTKENGKESLSNQNGNKQSNNDDNSDSPPAKKRKTEICVSCLGVLQEHSWAESFAAVKDMIDKKRYECETFACALSAPIATLLREKAMTLHIANAVKDYDPKTLTPLKEAWKWSFGIQLATHINKTLDSGAVSPLLITLNMEYPDDMQELEILKTLSPALFESRNKQKRRFTVEFTRRSVEQALESVSLEALKALDNWRSLPSVSASVKCVSVVCSHAPVYLGGRYIKLSRELPQSPWLVNGRRMMHSSVQETIFQPIAQLYDLPPEEVEHRLKFISAGREDVDVRCLGEGRPFAIEITDPRKLLSEAELQRACEEISSGGKVVVKQLVNISRDDLTELKKGEETKCKEYEALCIKLSHTKDDLMANGSTPITVSGDDITRINSYRNTHTSDPARVLLSQRTPIRVLHRRPLLARTRRILDIHAETVPDHPQLFVVRIRTEAGTYVKEWCHGELGRTRPSLADAANFNVDILALDVAAVQLQWPIVK